jgi:hypothetical protein
MVPFSWRPADAVSGCAMLVDRRVFERVGLFDEDYVFGFEDLDLCVRALAAGWRTACVGSTSVVHDRHASIGAQSPQRAYFGVRGHLRLVARHPKRQAAPLRWGRGVLAIGWNAAHAAFRSEVPAVGGLLAVARGVVDTVTSRSGVAMLDRGAQGVSAGSTADGPRDKASRAVSAASPDRR